MIYIGIVIALVAFFVLRNNGKNASDKKEMTLDTRIVLFLIGIMILGAVGGMKLQFFGTIGDLAFIAFIIYLGYLLFKKLFKK